MSRSTWDPKRRAFWVKIHLWLGLTIGLFWAIQGLTGALLVFHREFDRIGASTLTDAPMAQPTKLIMAAQDAAGQPIQRLTVVSYDLRLVEARYNDSAGQPQAIQIDAATGRIVGTRERSPETPFTGSGWRWIYLVHMSLMAGTVGRTAIGISGLFLAITLSVGLAVAWPKRRAWRAAFSYAKWKSAPQRHYGWHRAVGLLVALPLFVMAVTGSYQAFASRVAPMLGRMFAYYPMATMGHQMGRGETHAVEMNMGMADGMPGDHAAHMEHAAQMGISPDDALTIAQKRFPSGKFMNLELPVEHPHYYSVRFTLAGELRRWSGRATVHVDPRDGAIMAVYDPRVAPMLNRIDDAAYPVHMGEAGGLAGRLLVAFAGLSLPLFFVTGLLLWLRKHRYKKTKLHEATTAREHQLRQS